MTDLSLDFESRQSSSRRDLLTTAPRCVNPIQHFPKNDGTELRGGEGANEEGGAELFDVDYCIQFSQLPWEKWYCFHLPDCINKENETQSGIWTSTVILQAY